MNLRINKSYFTLLACVIMYVLAFSGCKTSKQTTAGKGINKARSDYFERLHTTAFNYKTLTARLHVNLDIPSKKMSSRVDLKMIKDEVFELSVQPLLGIEVFRLELTPDSIKVIDRMNKRYVAERLSALQGELPIDFNFYNLQSLFTNQLFLPGELSIEPNQYKAFTFFQEEGRADLSVKDRLGLIYTFHTDALQQLVETVITDGGEKHQLNWFYTNFKEVDGQQFPMSMQLQAAAKGLSQGKITLNYSRLELNKPLTLGIHIPAKYKRITFSEIMKMISKAR